MRHLIGILALVTAVSAKTYYATPSSSTSCPVEGVPCLTLSEYANLSQSLSNNYFDPNTTLVLLPGNHDLEPGLWFKDNVLNLEVFTSALSITTVTCSPFAGAFNLSGVGKVRIEGISFVGCMENEVGSGVNQFTLVDCNFDGQGRNGTSLILFCVCNSTFDSSVVSYHEKLEYMYQIVYGGAMYGDSSMVTVRGCTFSNIAVVVVVGNGNVFGGVMYFDNSTVTIEGSVFTDNGVISTSTYHGAVSQGGVLYAENSYVTIITTTFRNSSVTTNTGGFGGAVSTSGGTTIVMYSTFEGSVLRSSKYGNGGAIFADADSLTRLINDSSAFFNNSVVSTLEGCGGAVFALFAQVFFVHNVTFTNNTVSGEYVEGGAVDFHAFIDSTLFISSCAFANNSANGRTTAHGGGVYVARDIDQPTLVNVIVTDSVFNNNVVNGQSVVSGGAFRSSGSNITMNCNTFSGNEANGYTGRGGAIYLLSSTFTSVNFKLQNNVASSGLVYAEQSEVTLSGFTTISNNVGSLYAFSSNMTIVGETVMRSNSVSDTASQPEGGAVTGFQSDIVFTGRASLLENTAYNGGAILALETKVNLYGSITFAKNNAFVSGGGIYVYQSELNVNGDVKISSNAAISQGGGVHAISSTTKLTDGSIIVFIDNHAQKGGGMYLELNARLYVIKNQGECFYGCRSPLEWLSVQFTHNSAEYGGALYIADTNSGTCDSIPYRSQSTASECFFQVLSLYEAADLYYRETLNLHNTYFTNNTARVAGASLYGGLLDRCTVSSLAEFFGKYPDMTPILTSGTSYLLNTTNLQLLDFKSTASISSDPVRVCFCQDSKPDCNFHPKPIYVKKGETFTVSLVAVDEVNNTIANRSIHASVSIQGGLSERQSVQITNWDGSCTDLIYNTLSQLDSEQLRLFARGPCGDSGISAAILTVNIAPCPIGFNDSNLRCGCDEALYPTYVSNCSIDTESVLRKDNSWFAFVNTTDHQAFTLHRYCPFDYCYPPAEQVFVNLNIPNGANALCAFNRSGKLCGSCEDGLSVSLGSSRCKECTNSWLALLFVFTLAGVALVAFVLVFNLTVAVGTINGLIFYANIVASNRAIFLPFDTQNFLKVFISWVNLDFGFETCFYDGMNGYQKTWLQFAFPLYVLFLVAMVIVVAEHSPRFAKLLRMRTLNPVTTLATLILLSYTKFIRTIIASLSITTLEYSDSFRETVWLVDANIHYFSWKHSLLFIAAVVVLVVGLVYTSLLFLWQWLNMLYKKPAFKWVRNTELYSFMEAYQGPYNGEHRYWTGLLLLVRLILYIISQHSTFLEIPRSILSLSSVFLEAYIF